METALVLHLLIVLLGKAEKFQDNFIPFIYYGLQLSIFDKSHSPMSERAI
jgi:hypothetical protein